eukprot:CAMPEP_0198202854 /NCGR_PEP_ID=MMETSP1445-20131203/6081_1 /TAXON_ID=36898 /ORGANISM="Pyramimonas sp., Strain CCMP2087" /LENGTH=485 /DNA_ID=CAMNT_0043873975 /DNA_START=35 /DNA_END=1492 /DNA_ORIENTATION=+
MSSTAETSKRARKANPRYALGCSSDEDGEVPKARKAALSAPAAPAPKRTSLHIADPAQGRDEYIIDHIVHRQQQKGIRMWRVRWRGFGPENDTYEPLENLAGCEAYIAVYEKKREAENLAKDAAQASSKSAKDAACKAAAEHKETHDAAIASEREEKKSANKTSRRTAPAWKHFEDGPDPKDTHVYCAVLVNGEKCNTPIAKGSCPTALATHLMYIHVAIWKKLDEEKTAKQVENSTEGFGALAGETSLAGGRAVAAPVWRKERVEEMHVTLQYAIDETFATPRDKELGKRNGFRLVEKAVCALPFHDVQQQAPIPFHARDPSFSPPPLPPPPPITTSTAFTTATSLLRRPAPPLELNPTPPPAPITPTTSSVPSLTDNHPILPRQSVLRKRGLMEAWEGNLFKRPRAHQRSLIVERATSDVQPITAALHQSVPNEPVEIASGDGESALGPQADSPAPFISNHIEEGLRSLKHQYRAFSSNSMTR